LQAIEPVPYTGNDWSKKKFKERLAAEGATPSGDYSKDHMINQQLPEAISVTTTSTTTTTMPVWPFTVPGGDGPHGTPLDPLAQAWIPVPGGPPFFSLVGNYFRTPVDSQYLTGLPGLAHAFVLAPVTIPGVYTTAFITLRMQSAVPGDDIVALLYDVTGAPLVPGPGGPFVNTGPLIENITLPIPLLGPTADVIISGGVIDMLCNFANSGPIDIFEVTVELA